MFTHTPLEKVAGKQFNMQFVVIVGFVYMKFWPVDFL